MPPRCFIARFFLADKVTARRLTTTFCLLSFICITQQTKAAAEQPVRFNRDVRPILTDKCFACHGLDAETVEGGLRLDVRENAIDDSQAIMPGDANESEVIRRILSDDPDEVMPPPEIHKPVTAEETELLKRWITEGAAYEMHWAYTPMKRIANASKDSASKNSESQTIDDAIDASLVAENVQPTEQADRITLIRRLSFDLTGLPPTLQEVDDFVADPSEHAYAKLVDRLLNSPRFGERMAVYWLDLVRYADTVGYHGDQNVSQSPYRDYVINAFNQNMPYDQFIREQLAGDLLPGSTLEQKIASGYNRLNQTTEEGGSQAKEYLAIYFADRVRNVSQVFMGATVGCAQCHDHKYDPYTAKDFYALGAFFADIEEKGVYSARSRPPMISVPSESLIAKLNSLDHEITSLEATAEPLAKSLMPKQSAWEQTAMGELEQKELKETVWFDDAFITAGVKRETWKLVSKDQGPVFSGAQSRRQKGKDVVQHIMDIPKHPFSIQSDSEFFSWVYLDPKNPPSAVMLQFNTGDWSHRKVWGSDAIGYGRQPKSHPGYLRAGKLPETGRWVRLAATASELGMKPNAKIKGVAFTQAGGLAHWDKTGTAQSESLPQFVQQSLAVPANKRTAEQSEAVREHFLSQTPEMVSLRTRLESKKAARKEAAESAPLTVVTRSVKPRTIRILPRGNWMDDSGEIVEPAIPEFLGVIEQDEQRLTRLDLANWLSESSNPLTSRTMVNRLWSLMFGRGICASVDDFGGQGTYPSYPELLDELALEFIDSQWDVKQMLRTIALSQAYQRSSTPTEQLETSDPYNELFARQGRFCVDAESVRDLALAASGLLVEKVGGPSVRPYQPEGYYAQLNFPRRKYQADDGNRQYRRGLYTHWQRTFLHPMLKAFDAPSREECTAQRARSNTPLQALVLLNDPTFIEAARVFAERVVREGGTSPQERLIWAYRTVVSHSPSDGVFEQLSHIYQTHLENYLADPESAAQLIAHGDATTRTEIDPTELAAWTSVARVLLNLHETITRY